jgi:hypothetical protein
MGHRYLHDHDEELGAYWYNDSSRSTNATRATKAAIECSQLRPRAYWVETGRLVREYLTLQADAAYSETLRQGFISWLQHSPAERRLYVNGDDMGRAALADWYLKIVR